MNEYNISVKLKQLYNKQGYLDNDTNLMLFERYLNKLAKNLPKEDIDERTILILGNKKIIFHVLKTRTNIQAPYEDSEEYSVCMTGLIKAIDSYNVNSGVKFVTYAIKVVNNELYMYYRKINQVSNYAERTKVYLDDAIQDCLDDGESISYEDCLKDDTDIVEEFINKESFEKVIKNFKYLTKQEVIIVSHYYGLFGNKAKKHREIAEMFNMSRSNISRRCTMAIKKLRVLSVNEEMLTDDEIELKNKLINCNVKDTYIEK